MGLIILPSVDDILNIKDPNQRMEMLINTLGILMKELKELNGYISNSNIRAKTIRAEKMDVDKLSAISADLGTITAGEIYGNYIATKQGAYPRAEMSNTDDLFAVFLTADIYTKLVKNLFGSPALIMIDPVSNSFIYNQSAIFPSLMIQSTQDITIQPGTAKSAFLPSWSRTRSSSESQSLQDVFNSFNSALSGLQSQINSLSARVSALESA